MHNFCFIGASCGTRVTKQLLKKFKTLSQAEAAFDIDYFQPIAMEKAAFREDNTPLRTETDDTVDTSHFSISQSPFIASLHILNHHRQTARRVELGFLCCRVIQDQSKPLWHNYGYVPSC